MTTIHHHPSDETLAAYLRGSLDEGRRVLVAAHIELCASCARMAAASEHLAGLELESGNPAPLETDAIHKALERIDRVDAVSHLTPRSPAHEPPYGLATLSGRTLGPWRWIGPGVHWRSVSVPSEAGARVFMLKAAPGTSLPHHTHTGTELTLILRGAFAHQGGRFGIGDFDEADGTVEHQPVVERGEDCICLVAMEGQLRLLGLFGRLMQPFVRM
jgi:putative transcriptional regulator